MFFNLKIYIISCLLMVAVVLIAACGYKFSGSGSFPRDIKSICISVFENRSIETGLENTITNDLIKEVNRMGNVVLTDKKRADAVLSGIVFVGNEIISRRGNTPIEKRITVTVALKLYSSEDGVIWSSEGISEQEAYDVTGSDQEAKQNKDEATSILSRRLSEVIYRQLCDDF